MCYNYIEVRDHMVFIPQNLPAGRNVGGIRYVY